MIVSEKEGDCSVKLSAHERVCRASNVASLAVGALIAAASLLLVLGVGIAAAVPLGTITEFSTGLSLHSAPQDLVSGPDGNLWFTDDGNPAAVGRITPSGAITEFSEGLTDASDPGSLVTGPDGNLWFTDGKAIGRITPDGTIAEFSTGLNPHSVPQDLVLGPDGNLWFINDGNPAGIGQITPSGAITEFSVGLSPGSQPGDIVSGPDGNLWFTDGEAIGRVTADSTGFTDPVGTITEFTAGLFSGDEPSGIVSGPDGKLWFADLGCPKAIGRIAPDGTVTEFTAGLIESSCCLKEVLCAVYFGVDSIVSGPDGNLWFIDHDGPIDGAIGRITPSGTITEFSAGLEQFGSLQGLVSGPDGNLWFVGDMGPAAIGRITPSGTVTEFSTGLGESSLPQDLAPGPDGNLWFVDGRAIGRITTSAPIAQPPITTSTPIAQPPTTAISSTGSVSLVGTRIATKSDGEATVKLACTGPGTCRGKLTLIVRTRGKRKKRRSKTTTIGTAIFSIPPGKTTAIKLDLNAHGRVMFDASHSDLSASLAIFESSPAPSLTYIENVDLVRQKGHHSAKGVKK
jgi:streptogramin lyase